MTLQTPLLSRADAKVLINGWKQSGMKTVAVSGSFDLLHEGHIRFLTAAREQGDALLVLLNSDVSIRGYKGPSRPIISEQGRSTLLRSLRQVDAVMLFDDLTPLDIIAELQPDVLVNGSDYGPDCIERPIVESYGGTIHIVERAGTSEATSAIIAKIRSTPG